VKYVRTWTIWSDVVILLRAIPVVLFGRGAY
jgi:lipopolysaccharide/colanic/teichoic acid biosynthesis glycosyltransferase